MTKKEYVNNEDFYEALVEYRKQYELDDTIQIPEYLAVCLMEICHRVTFKPNFRNYSYRDEMAEDGLENSIRYIKTFDPEKSKKPFAYFTTIAHMACINRIHIEKKQTAIKAKHIQGISSDDISMSSLQEHEQVGVPLMDIQEYLSNYYDFDLPSYEDSIKNKRKSVKKLKNKINGIF